jgi:hypothetical protein
MLKRKIGKEDHSQLDPAIANLYKQEGEEYVLQVEATSDSGDRQKLSEFRDSNIQLRKQIEELTEQNKKLSETRDTSVNKTDIEALVQNATKALSEQVSALQKENSDYKERTAKSSRDSALREALVKSGVLPEAIPDALNRGIGIFSVGEDGKLIAKDGDAPLMSKKDATKALTPQEWAESLKSDARHLFGSPAGVGALGSSSSASGTRMSDNPFSKKTWNLTKQMILQKQDPATAEALKQQAEGE